MKKKRSKGVTFWGWVFIIFNIIGLLGVINPAYQKYYGVGILIIGIVSCVAYLICGIYILKLNEYARKAAIFLGIISVFSMPLLFKPVLNIPISEDYDAKAKQRITEQLKPEYQQKALENLEKSKELFRKALPIIFIVIFGVPCLIFELIPIYFFTRPKVKEQFK